MAEGLNPLTINHTAITISCKNMGKLITMLIVEKGFMRWNIIKKPVVKCIKIAMKPQTEIQRGMSLEWKNK